MIGREEGEISFWSHYKPFFGCIFFFGGQTLLIMFFSLIDFCYMIFPSRHGFFFFFFFVGGWGEGEGLGSLREFDSFFPSYYA